MERVRVDLGKKSYDIIIGNKIMSEISDHIKQYQKILVISNDKVGPLYSKEVIKYLKNITKEVYYYEIPDGEEYKRIETVLPIYDFMVENNLDRGSLVVSLGGGVVCDLSGYVASTFMRGIDFIQIPTSLLAQVDASIGGKVAVNHSKGKNLIGSFYQPKLVFVDTEVLNTLELREIKTGLAEIIKHSIVWDKEYFEYIYNNSDKILSLDKEVMINLIKRSCEIKAEVVSQDETERGVRAILNYGHTYGHVIENLTQYKIYRHGEAVVAGMMFAAYIAKELGMVTDTFIKKQKSIFKKCEIDYLISKFDFEKVAEILKHDKKVKEGRLIFIIPEKIGEVKILNLEEALILKVYNEIIGKNVKAVIDIGTNTTRLFVGEISNGKIINKYGKYMEITRLGEDVDKTRVLKDEAIERTIKVLKKYKEIADGFGVSEIKTVATSATRDSKNKDKFIDKAFNEAGINIETISGDEEGTYAFNGVLTDEYKKDVLVIDIGGGSTEFIYGGKDNIKFLKSVDIGSVRLKEKFFKDENYDSNSEEAKNWIFEKLKEIKELKTKDYQTVGVAGTITSQVSVIKKMKIYNSDEIHKYDLKLSEIEKNYKEFKNKNLEERKKICGLNPKRADVIASGTFLLKVILEYLEKDSLIVSENDILEGLLVGK